MNKDQINGTLKDAAGKIQEKAGEVVGSDRQQRKGLEKQIEGHAQKAAGDVKEIAKDFGKR